MCWCVQHGSTTRTPRRIIKTIGYMDEWNHSCKASTLAVIQSKFKLWKSDSWSKSYSWEFNHTYLYLFAPSTRYVSPTSARQDSIKHCSMNTLDKTMRSWISNHRWAWRTGCTIQLMILCLYSALLARNPNSAEDIVRLQGSKSYRDWCLSQNFFGWPSNRPRKYTILLKKGNSLIEDGLTEIEKLYRIPNMPSSCHMCAPPVSGLNALKFI